MTPAISEIGVVSPLPEKPTMAMSWWVISSPSGAAAKLSLKASRSQ